MTAPLGGGQPFHLGRFAGPPPLLVASEVLDAPMGIGARREVWQRVGVIPALTVVAGLFADLDLAAITDTRSAVERAFITGQVGDLQAPLLRQLSQGRAIFSNVGLVICIKEIVRFAVEDSEAELSALDLTRCVLGANQDNDQVDPVMMTRATNPAGVDIDALRADFHELPLDFVAQGLFDYTDSLETLASSVHETWRSAVHLPLHLRADCGQPDAVGWPTQAGENVAEGTAHRFSDCPPGRHELGCGAAAAQRLDCSATAP